MGRICSLAPTTNGARVRNQGAHAHEAQCQRAGYQLELFRDFFTRRLSHRPSRIEDLAECHLDGRFLVGERSAN